MNKLCIYHIEDNEGDRRLLAYALSEQPPEVPFEVHVARDGEEAVAVLHEAALGTRCRPDLIILDLNLPKRSGFEVLEAIRTLRQLDSSPVVILTSSDAPADRSQAEAFGVAEYLRKPMSLDEFVALGGRVLQFAKRSADHHFS